jgi:hypothetical protein
LKFPHRHQARRTGTAPLVAAAVSAVATFRSGLGVPDLAALAADFGRD